MHSKKDSKGKHAPGISQGEEPKAKKTKKLKAKSGMAKKSFKNVSDKNFDASKKTVDPMLSASNAKFYMC